MNRFWEISKLCTIVFSRHVCVTLVTADCPQNCVQPPYVGTMLRSPSTCDWSRIVSWRYRISWESGGRNTKTSALIAGAPFPFLRFLTILPSPSPFPSCACHAVHLNRYEMWSTWKVKGALKTLCRPLLPFWVYMDSCIFFPEPIH